MTPPTSSGVICNHRSRVCHLTKTCLWQKTLCKGLRTDFLTSNHASIPFQMDPTISPGVICNLGSRVCHLTPPTSSGIIYNHRSRMCHLIYCRAPHPVSSCLVPYQSFTHPLPVPYPSLTFLASLGLINGTGTDTIFTFSPPPLNFLEAFIVP